MEMEQKKELVAETGRMLLDQKLVARTWGNVSCRLDDKHYLITPSGLDYVHMTAEDIVVMNMEDGTYEGKHKPSGERGVHTAAYQVFADAGFVIHTHQDYATAIGLAGFDELTITEEEKQTLGGIALAGYGLPGTGKLTSNVRHALETGAKVVFMAHHGALICGKDREEAFQKAVLLEEICKRSIKGICEFTAETKEALQETKTATEFAASVHTEGHQVGLVRTPIVMQFVKEEKPLHAQLDDMAQMIGGVIKVVKKDAKEAGNMLMKQPAVIVPCVGILVSAVDESDLEALKLLVEKACLATLHTRYYRVKARLSFLDHKLMRTVYVKKYSKQK